MKRTLIGLATLLLALGIVLMGCSNPLATLGVGSANRAESGLQPGQQFWVSVGPTSIINVTLPDGSTGDQRVVQFYIQDSSNGNTVGIAYCGDINTGLYINVAWLPSYQVVSLSSYIQKDTELKLKAALTYFINNYPDVEENVGFYQSVVQALIWNIVNDAKINSFPGYNWWTTDEDGNTIRLQDMPGADQVMVAINDIIKHLDNIVTDYQTGVSLEQGTASLSGGMFGPYTISMDNSLFPGILFDLNLTQGAGSFVNANGGPISQIAPGEEFFVQVAPGATGDYSFTASASADNKFKVVNDITLLFAIPDAEAAAGNHNYQPIFQPLFQPLISTETQTYLYSVTGNFKIAPKGEIILTKNVDGMNIAYWASLKNIDYSKYITGFNLLQNGQVVQFAPVDASGVIHFTGLADGTYTVQEVLTAAGKTVFTPVSNNMSVTIINGIQINEKIDFDYNALYKIMRYDTGNMVRLGLNGYNGTGEVFPMWITDDPNNVTKYPTYCAHAGSVSFAGDTSYNPLAQAGECDGYMVATRMANYAEFAKAYNFIEANYGPLADNRVVTQVITWYLLNEVPFTVDQIQNITDAERAAINDVIANYQTFDGVSKIVDVVYMVCENPEHRADPLYCQPQLVPIYGNKPCFDNTYIRPVSPAYSSVTATNKGNVPTILAGLNAKNGNPLFDSKKPEDPKASTPFVVPNSNHFVFVKATQAELEAGVPLDFVVGNNYQIVGHGMLQLVNGSIQLTFDKFASGSFGMTAFNQLPVTNNGNIHSQKEADLKKLGATTGFNHDNKASVPCPTGNGPYYIYIHCDPISFFL
ncbi:MAG: hypothetical protein FWD78_11805 [Treponema sp.]|nr:hypothetical protein [Treponema sp.]